MAEAFAETGYRKATTAALARRCGVQETILYRLWPDKRRMFLAAIDHVFSRSASIWRSRVEEREGRLSAAERILAHEADHLGEFGLYRILFAGLSEVDDPEVAAHLRRTYGRFQRFVRDRIVEHRRLRGRDAALDADLAAWAILGIGTIATIGRETGSLTSRTQRALLADGGRVLLEGRA